MQKNLHFYGLDSLRAIAALAVVVSHIEFYKKTAGLENAFDGVNFFENAGNTGVILFFVLSGFLITYLLLHEREKTSAVNVRYFYIRRLLRIWSLYFFITALAFILAPLLVGKGNYYPPASEGYKPLTSLLMYVFFIPNLAFLIKMGAPMALHLWTIGVEEQFYLSVP
jgi:peptidoglycan/LPS O-acetylase OafA/YrhL